MLELIKRMDGNASVDIYDTLTLLMSCVSVAV